MCLFRSLCAVLRWSQSNLSVSIFKKKQLSITEYWLHNRVHKLFPSTVFGCEIIMAWVIVLFSDQTVSCVPRKWLVKIGKVWKCYFPKTGAAAKIKAAVDVDKNSKEWSLHSFRLLMDEGTKRWFLTIYPISFLIFFYRCFPYVCTGTKSWENSPKSFDNEKLRRKLWC